MHFQQEKDLIENGATEEIQRKRKDILFLFSQVLKAVNPYNAVTSYLKDKTLLLSDTTVDTNDFKNIYVVAFGKGSVGMTQAVCDHLPISKGIIITNQSDMTMYDEDIEIIVGGHPLPNENSIQGAKKIQTLLSNCKTDDLVIVLISGGGSALLASPRVSLTDLQKTTKALLYSGATIQEINTIRKHLSTVKGGQLVKSLSSRVVSFIISDVVGDPLEFISSGPTVGDSTTFSDAYRILYEYNLWNEIPDSVRRVITQGKKGFIPETPFPDDPVFSRVSNMIVANNSMACETVLTQAKRLDYDPVLVSTELTGEASELGLKLYQKAKEYNDHSGGDLFISGGEPTVTITGDGKGGRNQELALSMADPLKGTGGVFASLGTDGIDGMSPAAGAIVDGNTLHRAERIDMNVSTFLQRNDSFTFFDKLHDVLMTGPTGTNVMDVQILIL
jgi:glycerate 2-kinase